MSQKQSHSYILLMIFVLVLGFGLRLFQITANSLWLDEAYSFFLSQMSIEQIVRGTMVDQHPPLYYILLHFWITLGWDEFTLRFLSVIAGILSIAVLYKLGTRLISTPTGLMAALFLAISPIHIWYSQEVRMYVLLAFFGLLSIYLCWLIIFYKPQKWTIWLGFVITNLAALYTHNFAIFVLMFENLVWIGAIFILPRINFPVRTWLATQIIIFLGYTPWLLVLIRQTQHSMIWIPRPTPDLVRNTIAHLSFGNTWTGGLKDYLEIEIIFLLGLVLLWLMITRKNESWVATLFILLWFFVPFTLITLISFKIPLYQDKQFLFLVPGLILIFATSVTYLKPSSLKTGTILLMVGLSGLSLYHQYLAPQKTDWRSIARFIDQHAQTGDTIYLSAASSALPLNYYLTRQDIPQDGYPQIFDFEQGGWIGQLATQTIVDYKMSQLASTYQRIWFIDYGSVLWDPEGLIPAWLNKNAHLLGSEIVTGVNIGLYETDISDTSMQR